MTKEEPSAYTDSKVDNQNDESNNIKLELEALKLDNDKLVKNYNNIKKSYDKLNKQLEDAQSEVALTQISFGNIEDNSLIDEIANLDILNMTPLDAMNALYSLQKKAKNK